MTELQNFNLVNLVLLSRRNLSRCHANARAESAICGEVVSRHENVVLHERYEFSIKNTTDCNNLHEFHSVSSIDNVNCNVIIV